MSTYWLLYRWWYLCFILYSICQVTFLSEYFWRRCCIAHCHCLNFTYSISRITVPLDKPIWPSLENTREAQLHHVLSKFSYIESSSASWVILTLCPEPLRHYISPFRFNCNTPQQGWTLHPPPNPKEKKHDSGRWLFPPTKMVETCWNGCELQVFHLEHVAFIILHPWIILKTNMTPENIHKTNMEPENHLAKEHHLPNFHFWNPY